MFGYVKHKTNAGAALAEAILNEIKGRTVTIIARDFGVSVEAAQVIVHEACDRALKAWTTKHHKFSLEDRVHAENELPKLALVQAREIAKFYCKIKMLDM